MKKPPKLEDWVGLAVMVLFPVALVTAWVVLASLK